MGSRDIDALVATKLGIMARYKYGPATRRVSENMCWLDFTDRAKRTIKGVRGAVVRCDDDVPLYPDGLDRVPRYSSDIAAAWQAVEKMRAAGGDYAMLWHDADGWTARFKNVATIGGPVFEGTAATAPLAICLAALKACGVDAPERAGWTNA